MFDTASDYEAKAAECRRAAENEYRRGRALYPAEELPHPPPPGSGPHEGAVSE